MNSNLESLLRASAAVMMVFQIPLEAATHAVKRFGHEKRLHPDRVYELITGGRLALSPDLLLVEVPMIQTWFVDINRYPGDIANHGSMIESNGRQIRVPVHFLEYRLSDSPDYQEEDITTIIRVITQGVVSLYDDNNTAYVQQRLFIEGLPILGYVLNLRRDSDWQPYCTIRLELPLIEVKQASENKLVLTVSEHLRSTQKNLLERLKPCYRCKHYDGRSYGAGNACLCDAPKRD